MSREPIEWTIVTITRRRAADRRARIESSSSVDCKTFDATAMRGHELNST